MAVKAAYSWYVQQSTAGRLSVSLVCSCALKIAVHAVWVLTLAASIIAAPSLVYRKRDNALLSNHYHLDGTWVRIHTRRSSTAMGNTFFKVTRPDPAR